LDEAIEKHADAQAGVCGGIGQHEVLLISVLRLLMVHEIKKDATRADLLPQRQRPRSVAGRRRTILRINYG
jgi:hypothetical protein